MDPNTLERLELKIAYLEKANTELSDVVYRQQREIAELQDRFTKLKDRFEALATNASAYTAEDEKPPHY
jgi:SlyX protein